MDGASFDRLARIFGSTGTRRAALGALLGTGVAGTLGAAEAAKKDRNRQRQRRKQDRGKAQVSAQAADCLSPGHGSNISGCNYTNENFSGQDLSSSRMVGTIFRNAELVETDLSSSNAKDATFRDANLCGADLSSSTLRNANFRDANLALADLHSSACGGATFTAGTFFCGTIDCNGNVRNDDCPGGVPSDLCCTPCGVGEQCIDNECVGVAVCDEPIAIRTCDCVSRAVDGVQVCRDVVPVGQSCSAANPACPGDAVCVIAPCAGVAFCKGPCQFPGPCTCPTGVAGCGTNVRCGEITAPAQRLASRSPFKPQGPRRGEQAITADRSRSSPRSDRDSSPAGV